MIYQKVASHSAIVEGQVIVGMSGGVDSSVAAMLLLHKGYAVKGLFMNNWDESDCTANDDFADACAVCEQLGISIHTVNFAVEYKEKVFKQFIDEFRAGFTPNPDMICNREIKFNVFLEYAKLLGADLIATGHYVRRDAQGRLLKGVDEKKDQSYFLHAISAEAIKRTLFPIGEMEKSTVRALAKREGLHTAQKKDSTGICFIGDRRFVSFLRKYLPTHPGTIENEYGNKIGDHIGLMYYTIGQRHGLGIGGKPWYVAAKDIKRNVIIAVQGKHHPLLYANSLVSSQTYWVSGAPNLRLKLKAKVRYSIHDQPCGVWLNADGSIRVRFDKAQRALTPGQSVVLYEYDGDVCLGGGVITYAAF